MKRIVILLFFLCFISHAYSQDRFSNMESQLTELTKKVPGLAFTVNLSVSNSSMQEFIRGIAVSNDVNISVDPSLTTKITNNFSSVKVSDVLIFLCKNYNLDLNIVGTIITIGPYQEAKTQIIKQLNLTYFKDSDLLSYDFKDDSLVAVSKELTVRSGRNVLVSPDLMSKTVSGFIQNLKFETALEKLGLTNDLKVSSDDGTIYLIERKEKEQGPIVKSPPSMNGKNNLGSSYNSNGLTINLTNDSLLSVSSSNNSIIDILTVTSKLLKKRFFLYNEIKGTVTFSVTDITFDNFLSSLLNNTDYTYKKIGDLYLFGERSVEGLRETHSYQLKYRSADKIIDVIPAELKKGVEIKPFPDLNSLIFSGSLPKINEIENFLNAIDKVVPVVLIEVIIVDVRNTRTVSTGIQAGLGDKPVSTQGSVYPGVDLTLGSSSINNIISGINGAGSINLGKVTPNFYLKLKLLEEQGYLKLRSTPKLATLNGHEAKLSIGRTEYYQESQTTILGSVTSGTQTAISYKPVTADLAVSINPMVSGDEQITLDVSVKQSSFTERIAPTAPPGTITRDFQSLIRIRNEEMIILGGLEENNTTDTGSGVPLLSRIPVIKWFFSSRTKGKTENKLVIFIKPTVIY